MKKAIFSISLVLLLFTGIASYSQGRPSPTAQNQVQLTVVNPQPSVRGSIDSKGSSNAMAVKDDPIVKYTFWLTVFTGLLVFCNVFLWLYTKKAADAAKRSADVLPVLEKAYVIVTVSTVDYQNIEFGGNGADVVVLNSGRTPATISKCRAVLLGKDDSLSMEGSDILPGAELGSNKEITIPLRLTAEEVKRIEKKGGNTYCHVTIEYEDIFQQRYAKRLTWEYKSSISFPEGYWELCDNKELSRYA